MPRQVSKCSIHDMDADAIQLDLEIDSMTPVAILHVESTNEFYVHHCDNTKKFVSNQNRINALLKSSAPLVDHSYALGDYVFVHSSDDWYRGLITQIRRRSTAGNDDDDDDDLIYQVYCVDFGHRENDVTRHQLRPIQFISHALPSQQHQSEEASSIITLPFQAVCCQLSEKRESTRNTETLKTLLYECLSFAIRVKSIGKHALSAAPGKDGDTTRPIEINKCVVSLYSEDVCHDDKFESTSVAATPSPSSRGQPLAEAPTPATAPATATSVKAVESLTKGGVYEVKVAYLGTGENEFFVNLIDDAERMASLTAELNADARSISVGQDAHWRSHAVPDAGALVLAKYFETDEAGELVRTAFEWYRGVVVSLTAGNTSYEVLYVDYGNKQAGLGLADLAPLPDKYHFDQHHPLFAHQIHLHGVRLSVAEHGQALIELMGDGEMLKMRVLECLTSAQSDLFLDYSVELWSADMSACLNTIIDANYTTPATPTPPPVQRRAAIETSAIETLFAKMSELGAELRVTTAFSFVEKFHNPFYFCLSDDALRQSQIDEQMNAFYQSFTVRIISSHFLSVYT